MIKGINNTPYFDMSKYIDMKKFNELQPEILTGFAESRMYAKEGTWMTPGFTFNDMSYRHNWKPIFEALEEFKQLPDSDPIKQAGSVLYKDFKNYQSRNKFTRFLKMALGAYDPYIYYFLWEEGSWDDRTAPRKLTEEAQFFPKTVQWVEDLITNGIFEHIGRVIFFHCEHGGVPFEHRDLGGHNGVWEKDKYSSHRNEFIHIRPNTKKAMYLWDPESKDKTYLNTRAAWWNDQDWHGGEAIMEQSYSLRIDGKFTEEFRKKLGIAHIDSY
jgi:hypothetical protein